MQQGECWQILHGAYQGEYNLLLCQEADDEAKKTRTKKTRTTTTTMAKNVVSKLCADFKMHE